MIPALQTLGVSDGPIFVNFDGWGVDTPASLVSHVGRMKAAEVLVTFQTAWFLRFFDQAHQPAGDKVFGTTAWREKVASGTPAEKKSGLIGAYRSMLDRAGFTYQLDFELLDEGGHELLLFFGTSHTDGIVKMKDSMWHVDRVNGRRFRDLWWFTQQGAFDEALIRRPTYLKVYVDVVEEGIADGPFDAESDLIARVPADFPPEAIGLLIGTPETETWLKQVNERFDFLADPTEEEARLLQCDPRDSYEVSQLINALGD
ncbi:MAG TPA: three-Cys-motif partner protein TcmP [Acidimicrobiia bacterium]